eukprot:scaffold2785_cov302-Prasinococcus_capsulatus_cf.AAC.1
MPAARAGGEGGEPRHRPGRSPGAAGPGGGRSAPRPIGPPRRIPLSAGPLRPMPSLSLGPRGRFGG